MAHQYDAFAADYDWLFSDRTLAAGPFVEQIEPVLATLPAGASVLDCACGTGRMAIALARRGYRTVGYDASEGMVAQARANAIDARVEIPFAVCAWQELPGKVDRPFDLVLCLGNSIGHCCNEDEILRSFRGMRAALRPGAHLAIHSRNWERVLAERSRLTHFGVRCRNGHRCIPLYIWTFPREPNDPLVTEVVLVLEQEGKVTVRSYSIEYWPFRQEQIVGWLETAGFEEARITMAADEASYLVMGRKGR